MSFALGTTDGNNGTWDFGVQLYRTTGATNYVIAHRVDIGSSGTSDVTGIINNNAGAYGTEVTILMRVTDAGAETGTDFNSRVELFLDGSETPFYSTDTDTSLPNKFRFDGASRFIMWDIAPSAIARYDNFSITSTYAPEIPSVTWTGGGADDNWSTGDNWNGAAPTGGTALFFDGTTRQTSVNDLEDMTAPWLTFNNGGFSFSGNSLDIGSAITNAAGVNTFGGDLTFSATGLKVWSIASGSELVLNNTTSVEVGGDHEIYGGGTLLLTGALNIGVATTANPAFVIGEGQMIVDGGTYSSRGGYRLGAFPSGIGAQTILTNGATFSLTQAAANLRVGDSANSNTTHLDINNSTLNMAGGSLGIPYVANATGMVSQVGGTVSGAVVIFNDAGAGSGTYTIKDGTLEAVQIREDFAAGSSSIYFDNAILRTATGANTNFFSGVDVAEIQSGGLTIDAFTDVAVAQVLSGSGNLVKTGFSKVTLTGPNTYVGNTVVQAGRLGLPTVQTNATTVQVEDGAEFGVSVITHGSTLSVSALNFSGNSFHTMSFDLGSNGSPSVPIMRVPNLSVAGPVTVNVENGFLLSIGQIVLVDYDVAIGGGFQFTLGSLPFGVTAELVHNTANTSIDLNITAVPALRWTGATSGDWDNSTANWLNLQTGSASAFFDGVPTEFLDGATSGNINLGTFPTAPVITVSNDVLPYVWSGEFFINTPILKKFGNESLTRNGGETDAISGIELNAGAYIISHFFDMAFGTVLTDAAGGTGTFVKQGPGKMTVTSANTTYDGAIVIQEGILKLGATGALGSTTGGTTIANGATLDLNNRIAPHEPVIVSGAGVDGLGAIIDSIGGGVDHELTDVTMVGHTTFGAPGARWDIRVRTASGPGPGLRGNGFDLTKVGPGALSIACQRHFNENQPYWEMNLGDVFINEGSLTFAESLTLGNDLAKILTIASGATLGTYDLNYTNPIVRNVFLTDATIASNGGGGGNGTNAFSGVIQVTGLATFRGNNAKLVFDGPITGSGSVAVGGNDAGAVYLNGVNTYPGDTTVNTILLGGNGSLAGNLVVVDGTTAPGFGLGTLTVNGNATLGGTTLMELDRSQSPNSDRLVVNGSMSWSGVLNVVLGAGAPAPQAGDVYQLFNKAGSGTFTTINLPNLSSLPGGLAWDISNLSVDGTITVTGTATPPTIGTVSINDGNFVFDGTGGIEGGTYIVLSSTDVALPLVNWTPVATNTFGAGGSFSYSSSMDPGAPATFFLLQLP
ncbi:MAG: autotransporter-associated beta strand repeat-containing protein [Verrucomicrobia bacterium]|nr:autotransporter-associated beta strand repeat-containing protein [Verrucomicrobiota bacterium]